MAKLIELTDSKTGHPILINVDYVIDCRVRSSSDGGSKLRLSAVKYTEPGKFEETAYVYEEVFVKEPPHEVFNALL